MNLYTKPLSLIMVSTLFAGLIAFVQVQSSSAQPSGFVGLDKIPGANLLEKFLGNGNSNPSSASAPYLDIDKAVIAKSSKEVQAVLQAHGHIPTNGEGGAFGYGLLTNQGLKAVMVSTTHKGVYDSEDQRNANDARWHNHYVSLDTPIGGPCGTDPQVTAITFQSPGQVVVNKDKAVMSNLPGKFTGTSPPPNEKPVTINPGTNVEKVVSFVLKPLSSGAVCVTDIHPADRVIKN